MYTVHIPHWDVLSSARVMLAGESRPRRVCLHQTHSPPLMITTDLLLNVLISR